MGGDDFAEYLSKEQRIAELLRRWESLPKEERDGVTADGAELANVIEGFLCDVFCSRATGPASGWWCDGVTALAISALQSEGFRAIGGAFWADRGNQGSDFYLAPFELEFHGVHAEGAERIVVRFGALGRAGGINRSSRDTAAEALIAKRPQRDGDWAFAVELT
jgi:hypothetical protein